MAAPSIRQSAGATSSSTTSPAIDIPLSSSAIAGNLLVVCVAGDKNTGNLSMTGTGWNVGNVSAVQLTSSSVSLYIAWKVAAGGETTLSGSVSNAPLTGNTFFAMELEQAGAGTWALLSRVTNNSDGSSALGSLAIGTTSPSAPYEGLAVAVGAVDSISSFSNSPSWTNSFVNRHTPPTSGAPGSGGGSGGCYVATKDVAQGTTTSTTFDPGTGTDQISGAIAVFGRQNASTSAPTVSAGADVTDHERNTEFARTATENDNGATITARGWEIISGPADVGATYTTQTINYTPTVSGTYVLRYSATNSAGTSTDDMSLTVVNPPELTPGDVLNIGTAAGQVHFGFDIGEYDAPERVLYPPSDIDAGLDIVPEFTNTGDDLWVQCSVRADAPTTGGSSFPRSEGREYQEGSDTTLGFNPKDGGTHWMRFRARVTEAPSAAPHIATGQLHSAQDDIVMVRTRLVSGTNTLVLRVYDPNIDNTVDVLTLDSNYVLGDIYDLMFLIHGDWVYVFYQDFTQYVYRFSTSILPTLSTYFFKMGAYIQFNESTSGVNSTDFGTVNLRNAHHWHTGWATPVNYFNCPEVDPGSDATLETNTPFNRTATETGSGITERKWTILEGPDGAGTSIGTAAELNWTPIFAGNYVLMYGAKNDQGWSNPTFLNVTVTQAAAGGGVRSRISNTSAAATTHNVALPGDAQIGDRVVVGFVNDHADASAAPSTGWTNLGTESQGTTTNHSLTLFTRVLDGTANDALTVTITDPTHANSVAAAWSVICMNGDGGAPIAPAVLRLTDGGNTSGAPQTVSYTGLTSGDYDSLIFLGLDNNFGVTQNIVDPSGWENPQTAGNSTTAIYSHSTDLQLLGVTDVTPGAFLFDPAEQWITGHVVMPALTAVAPTVSAGADATIDQYAPFSRTATENNGGAPISSRAWTVLSGPNQVGATLSTSATINWEPTVGGSYVLRYTATNSQGTGADDVAVTVNSLNFPVTGSLILSGAQAGLKNVSSTESGTLHLSGSFTGNRSHAFSPTAVLHLDGSATGHRINVGSGTIRLHGEAINVGRPGQANVSGKIKLQGSAGNASRITTGVATNAIIHLQGDSDGTKIIDAAASGLIQLAGDVTDVLKNVPGSPEGILHLDALVSDVFHASSSNRLAEIMLSGEAINPEHHVTTSVPVQGNLVLGFSALTSSVRFNNTGHGNLILKASVFGRRIIAEIGAAILPRADNTTKYELVVVARIPQISGPPAFFEVDPLDWTSITYSEELSGIPTMSASVKIGSLTPDVKLRLQTLHDLPTELWLYRNGKHVFAGPLLGFNAQDEDSISLQALGLMAYTQMWFITKDFVYENVDQFTIVKGLIDQWQELEYGNYGIVTPDITSGVLRTITYNYKEIHNVYDRISELTKMVNGFDISIDPAGRNLELYYPYRGVDRSLGEDRIVFDQRNVTSSNIVCSIAPQDLASEGLGTGTGPAQDETFVGVASNPDLRAKYGRTGVTGNFGQVADQTTLDAYIQAMVDARGSALLIPGPNARVSVDSDIASYDIGDTVDYQLHTTLSVSGAFRIRKRTVSVRETGTEAVSIEFV